MSPLLLLLFVFLFDVNQAAPVDQEKIVGGEEAMQEDYSWEVSLGNIKDVPTDPDERQEQSTDAKLKTHFCDGVLLTENWVITAAHCVVDGSTKNDPMPLDRIGVGAGHHHDLIEMYDQGRVPASHVMIKPGYHSDAINSIDDIALVKLREPIANVKPACVPNQHDDNETSYSKNGTLTTVGWGNVQPLELDDQTSGQWTGIQLPRRLKQVDMKDVSSTSQYCVDRRDLICVAPVTPNQGPAKGDNGGSLVVDKTTVVGLTSFGGATSIGQHKHRTSNGDAAFIRLEKHIGWIKSIVKDQFCTQ